MVDIDNLEMLAKAATRGPWKHDLRVGVNAVYTENNNPNCLSDVPDSDYICNMHGIYFDGKWNMTEQQDNNCKYIAAVNPAVVLELIEELQQTRKERNWLAENMPNSYPECHCPEGHYRPDCEPVPTAGGKVCYECLLCWLEAAHNAVEEKK